jgi:excinuclease ABC subunit C
MPNPNLAFLRQKAMALPQLPGVYIMKDGRGGVLYIGKAKSLRHRVAQYFGEDELRGHSVMAIGLEHVRDFDYIVVGSEFEALVLECSLIKQHAPKYNINLKDDKGYRWVKITRGEWPRLSVAKQKHDDGADYHGPYASAFAVNLAADQARQVFRLPTCALRFPQDIGKNRPCLQHFIDLCAAPCARKIDQEAYAQSVRDAVEFLKRGSAQSEKQLRRDMEQAAEALDFERAAKLRDRLRAMEKIQEKQHVVSAAAEDQDVFALMAEQTQACWAVLRFCGGRLCDSEHFFLPRPDHFEQARQELLERYYTMRGVNLPRRILLDGETDGRELLEEWLASLAGRRVSIQTAQKGEPLRLVELCRQNAIEKLAHRTGRQSKAIAALEELAKLLGLPAPPQTIEAYDVSHTAGSGNVGGMVVFRNGAPLKAAYKRFAVKGFEGQDDYASMAEILDRRLRRYAEGAQGFAQLPDLILLDGGIGQVHAVQSVLARHKIEIPLFGMVKDSKHKTRAIAGDGGQGTEGKELALTTAKAAFALVTAIQEEAHRFAVAYHRQKRKAQTLESELTKIPGIGPARAKLLLQHFRTVEAIQSACAEELAAAPGMNAKLAGGLRAYYAGGRD